MFQCSHFSFIDVNAVGGQNFGLKDGLFFDVRNDWHSLVFAHVFNFKGSFGKVDMQWDVKFHRKIGCGSQDIRCAGVRCMRRHGGND